MTPTIRPTGLRKRGILAMIVLTIVSLGFYLPVWFLRRRAAFNALDSPRSFRPGHSSCGLRGAFYLQHAINAYVLPLSSQDAGA